MRPTKRVAVFVETARAYGRGLLRGISRFHQEHGTWSIFFQPADLLTGVPRWFKSWDGDGLLARISTRAMARAIVKIEVPFIDLRGASCVYGVPPFGPNAEGVCRLAFEHLQSRGLKNFAYVGEPVGRHIYDDERRDCFSRIIQQRGTRCHLFEYRAEPGASINWEKEQRQFRTWVHQLPKPIGIMAGHDDRGMQILEACREQGIAVPEEVAVIGVDNDEFLCNLAIPSLSSIDLNSERIGYEAAQLLDRMMDEKERFDRPRFFAPLRVVARQSTDVLTIPDRDIATALRFIQQNACSGIRVSDVAQHVAVSRTLFNRRFKQLVGHAPKEDISRVQIETAKQLLVETDLSVGEVARLTGFAEAKYFITVFAKRVGKTPRAYRMAHGRFNGLMLSGGKEGLETAAR
jgi:LacI family transcriptional regulator